MTRALTLYQHRTDNAGWGTLPETAQGILFIPCAFAFSAFAGFSSAISVKLSDDKRSDEMKKKLKGSALLWAVCALLIVVFVLTGLLALNKTYAEEEINNIAARRAEYLARSGVELTADMITNKKLVGDTDIKTWVVSPDSEKKEDGTYLNGTAPDEKKLEVVFSTDNGEIKVTVERIGDDVLSLKSFAEAGYMNRTVTAIMEYDNAKKIWELTGYATN